MSCSRSSVCRTLVEAEGSSLNKQWFEIELTLYSMHSPSTWRRHNDKKLRSGQSLATEYTWLEKLKATLSSWPIHSRTILKDCEKKCKLATKSTNIRFPNLKIPILRETRETIPRTWFSKVSLLSNFTPRMSRLRLARMKIPDKINTLPSTPIDFNFN